MTRGMVKLQERTQAYCAEVKASPDCWRLCADRFAATGYVEVKFWCLQALHEVLAEQHPACGVSRRPPSRWSPTAGYFDCRG